MKVVTLRNLTPKLVRAILARATGEGTSITKAVIRILEEATGVRNQAGRLHHDLDELAGRWSAEEAQRFEQELTEQRKIDPELWQ